MSSGQIVKEFLIESFENLSNISDQLTQYENERENKDLLNSIYRKVHTLKGSANFLNYKKLQEVTHNAENLLDDLREKKVELSSNIIDVLLKTFDCCQVILQNIESNDKEGNIDIAGLIDELKRIQQAHSLKENILEMRSPLSTGTVFSHDSFKGIEMKKASNSSHIPTEDVSSNEAGLKIVLPEIGPSKEEVSTEVKDEKEETPTKNIADSVVRVNVELLDKIMNVVGELVLNRNQILQYAGSYENSELNRLAQQLNGITTELQTDIMTTRMQPVGTVFAKFDRVVRDLSRSQDKKIKLSVLGKETELDKTLLDAIRDPLTHLIRNAADHGIETPEKRTQNGKSNEGHIQIRAYHEGGQVTIEIQDDGQGLDPEKISRKALEKGIVTKDELERMSKNQIQSLIMMPGFSTVDKVTNLSGRGVGMDVVKSNIEKIGGSVDISSEPGNGSVFKLKIPLTLAIVPALVIEARKETFAIPQVNLVELVRIEDEHIDKKIERIHQNEFFRLRGNLIPVFRLGKELDLEPVSQDEITKNIDKSLSVAVLNAEGVTYGLIVDQVLDTQEIVVKPLSKNLKELSVFAGATIMGDGHVALIVDALGFYNKVTTGTVNKAMKSNVKVEESEDQDSYSESKEILLTELGDGQDYGIPLVLVSRLEELSCSSIEWSGDRALMRYRNKSMPLIDMEKALDLKGDSLLARVKNTEVDKNDRFDCVVVKIGGQSLGLVVKEIKDIAITDSEVSNDIVAHPGMMGTVFIGERTITIIDVHTVLKKNGIKTKTNAIKKGRILLVEDSPLYQKIQMEILNEHGFEVVLEENGRAGLERLQKEEFDLVVTDIEMPEMNGWEFASAVRKLEDDKLRTKPIVAVSTRVSKEDLAKGVKSGFTKHLEKFDKDEVLEAINFCMAS